MLLLGEFESFFLKELGTAPPLPLFFLLSLSFSGSVWSLRLSLSLLFLSLPLSLSLPLLSLKIAGTPAIAQYRTAIAGCNCSLPSTHPPSRPANTEGIINEVLRTKELHPRHETTTPV